MSIANVNAIAVSSAMLLAVVRVVVVHAVKVRVLRSRNVYCT